MKYIKQFAIIITVSFLGEILNLIIPLPIPASIWGLALMLVLLCLKIVPLGAVKDCATFLVSLMQIMFIPAAVGLIGCADSLRTSWLTIVISVILSHACHSMPRHTAVRAAFSAQKECGSNYCRHTFGSYHKCLVRARACVSFFPLAPNVCHPFAKVHNERHRNEHFRGAWRNSVHYGSSHHPVWNSRKYARPLLLPNI